MCPMANVFGPEQKFSIRYKGLFDMDKVYSKLKWWLEDKKYEVHEDNYKAREDLKEYEIYIKAWRNDTPYVRSWIYVTWKLWDVNEVEVIKEKKKQKMMKARTQMDFEAYIETDYEKKWEKNAFLIALRSFYDSYINKKRLEFLADYTENECIRLIEFMKSQFGMAAKE